MPLTTFVFWVNAVLLILALVLAIIMMRAGSAHQFNYGNIEVQNRMKWIILRCLLLLLAIGIAASVFNLVVPLV
ncbi:MAG: hypothetical protein WEA04_03305 [Candidatus Andersenbacteria bacterium]